MPLERLDRATFQTIARLLAAETQDFNSLVEIAGLDPARDFRLTDLSGTNMAGADLYGFDFSGTDFRNVTLDGARISGACFRGADLSGTNLSRATGGERADCSFAVFQDAPFAPEMVVLPAGSFFMGSPEGEAERSDEEGPQRQVAVAGFAIGRYPVTFAEYDYFCDATEREKPKDQRWGRGRMPVINVSWLDAVAYVAWLSDEMGKDYRLPSEAEWEYACRAETTSAYWWGDAFDPKKVNIADCGAGRTTEVGSYPANAWGLFDTLGNVWEWVEDHWHDTYKAAPSDARARVGARSREDRPRVMRGGSWLFYQDFARCAFRFKLKPTFRNIDFGFRVVCSSPS